MAVRCLSQYHNRLGPEYDGRIEVLREGKFSRIERCKVCGREYLIQYASSKEEIVKIELEEWQDKAMNSMPEFKPDNLIEDPFQMGGKDDAQVEVLIPVSELPSIWRKAKQWYENWRKSH